MFALISNSKANTLVIATESKTELQYLSLGVPSIASQSQPFHQQGKSNHYINHFHFLSKNGLTTQMFSPRQYRFPPTHIHAFLKKLNF